MRCIIYKISSHSVYDIECHVVFCVKHRYMVLYGNIAERCIDVIREVCSVSYVEINRRECKFRLQHTIASVSLHLPASKVVRYIKEKSSGKPQGKFQELRKRYRGQPLWAREYFVATSGQISAKEVQKYIWEQETHHKHNHFKVSEFLIRFPSMN